MELGKDTKINLPEGVDKYKFDANRVLATNASKVEALLKEYDYVLTEIPGEFAKFFTKNEKEIADLKVNLEKIREYGLTQLFNMNLKPAIFSNGFISRLEICLEEGLQFYDEQTNSFKSFMFNKVSFEKYRMQAPKKVISPVETFQDFNVMVENDDNKLNEMDAEDKQVYNEINEKLSFLVLANPTDEYLVSVVANIKEKVIESILRKEYKFLSLYDIISNVMFNGLDVTPVENVRIEEIISKAFPVEERKLS